MPKFITFDEKYCCNLPFLILLLIKVMCIKITAGLPFLISIQPKDVCCKPGEEVVFTISTAPSATTYKWYFENQAISNPDYKGHTSECLLISKFFPKHKGAYWCVAEDASGTQITSRHVILTAGNLLVYYFILYSPHAHIQYSQVMHACESFYIIEII